MTLPNGDEFSSEPELMPVNHPLEEVNAAFSRKVVTNKFGIQNSQRIIKVTINNVFLAIDRGEDVFLRYGIEEDFSYPEVPCGGLHIPKTCYINEPSFTKDFTLFDSRLSNKNNVDSLLMLEKFGLKAVDFRGKHYFTVNQYSLTEKALHYWERVKAITNQQGTVFDKPPAAVLGNMVPISESNVVVLGYFELANVSIKRTSILPFQYFAESPDQDECSIFNRRNWPDRCCSCSMINGATTLRPDWF